MEDHALRPMRRQDREADDVEARDILSKGIFGVLSTVGPDGLPYGVPVSYVYYEGEVLIHSAPEGRKVENILNSPQVSFCVVGLAEPEPEMFSMRYASAIVSGTVRELFEDEKQKALERLIIRYSPDFQKQGIEYISTRKDLTRVFALKVEQLTGKRRY
jgi:hypothetical protein